LLSLPLFSGINGVTDVVVKLVLGGGRVDSVPLFRAKVKPWTRKGQHADERKRNTKANSVIADGSND
jgi:hypothetical protein